MPKKIILCSIFFLFTISANFCQSQINGLTYKESKEETDIQFIIKGFIGEVDNKYFAVCDKFESEKISLVRMTKDYVEELNVVFYKPELEGINGEFFQFFVSDETLYSLAIRDDRSSNTRALYKAVIDKNTLAIGKYEKMFEYTYEGRNDLGIINFSKSQDESKVLCFLEKPGKNKEFKKIDLYVYDSQMSLEWKSSYDFPYLKRRFMFETFKIDDVGNVFLLGIKFSKDMTRKKDDADYTYHLFTFPARLGKFKETEITIENKFITDLRCTFNFDNKLIFLGLLSEPNTIMANASCYLEMDDEVKVVKFSIKNIEFSSKTVDNEDVEKSKQHFDEFKISDIYFGKDNSAYLVAEQYKEELEGNGSLIGGNTFFRDGGLNSDSWGYLFDDESAFNQKRIQARDVLIIKASAQGKILWNKLMIKKQVVTGDHEPYASIFPVVSDEGIMIFYNDSEKNFAADKDPDKIYPFYKASAVLVVYALDNDGKESLTRIEAMHNKAIFSPKLCRKISSTNYFLYFTGTRSSKPASLYK